MPIWPTNAFLLIFNGVRVTFASDSRFGIPHMHTFMRRNSVTRPCSYLTVIAASAVRWGQAREAVRSAAAYREASRPDLHPALEPSPARPGSAAQVCSG